MSMFDDVMKAAAGSGIDLGGLDLGGLAGQLGGGNLQGMIASFEQGGMGGVVQSWISTGANLPISHEQLVSVLGSDVVKNLATSVGIDPTQVATVLPAVFDKLTPNGHVPTNLDEILGSLGGAGGLGSMLGGLLKS